MSTILKDLYYGKIRPAERKMPDTKEYSDKFQHTKEIEDDFLSRLNDKEKELFEKLREAEYKTESIDDFYVFTNAFRLGARLMIAILIEETNAQ